MIYSIIGLPGSGKTVYGRRLALGKSCRFEDLDAYIEHKKGKSIPEIIREEGETAFRMLEAEALRDILIRERMFPSGDLVLATGGGTPTIKDARRLLKEKTHCIYLKADAATLAMHLKDGLSSRPVLMDAPGDTLEQKIGALLDERAPLYESIASETVTL